MTQLPTKVSYLVLYLLKNSLEDVHTSVGHVNLGLLIVRGHKVIITLTERERERQIK